MSEFPILVSTGENTSNMKLRVTERGKLGVLRRVALIQVNTLQLRNIYKSNFLPHNASSAEKD